MSSPTPPLDAQLDLLSNAERRRVLTILAEGTVPLTLRDVASELVTHGHDAPLTAVPAEEVTTAYIRLHHVHIPKLAAAGVLDYDADRQRIDETSLDWLDSALSVITDGVAD